LERREDALYAKKKKGGRVPKFHLSLREGGGGGGGETNCILRQGKKERKKKDQGEKRNLFIQWKKGGRGEESKVISFFRGEKKKGKREYVYASRRIA